jgi:peptidoglycan L-alanyl-D-glutamate endopeptidase CwlK
VAAQILALFLKRREKPIKAALLEGDLKAARKLVNGGSHGLEAFSTAYRTGDALLPVS